MDRANNGQVGMCERGVFGILQLRILFVFGLCSTLIACGPNVYDTIELMPSPAIFADGNLDPFDNVSGENFSTRTQLFYATDRAPATPQDPQSFYNNERSLVLRTGVASVAVEPAIEAWEEARRISLMSDRGQDYTLRLASVAETGVMPFSATRFVEDPPSDAEMRAAGERFAAQINAQLANSSNNDIFIYTHG